MRVGKLIKFAMKLEVRSKSSILGWLSGGDLCA